MKEKDNFDSVNENSSNINHSGNSDVDIIIKFDTIPLSYAILCYLRATQKLDDDQFNLMVKDLKGFIDKT